MQNCKDPTSVARRFAQVKQAIDARRDIFTHQGVIVAIPQRYKDRIIGPYYRVGYYERGGVRWIYLGPSKRLANRVRHYLKQLQAPRTTRRQLRDLRVHARSELQQRKKEFGAELKSVGLRCWGFEVRGWTNHL